MLLTLLATFPAPEGTARVPGDAHAAWLRALPLHPPGHAVHTYEGDVVDMPAAAVLAWPMEGEAALQCADWALRLRATWARSQGQDPAFHYTSGDLSRWTAWAAGARPRVSGSDVTWSVTSRPDSSDASFGRWLSNLYQYAGTRSVGRDSEPVEAPAPGDFLLIPGSPGHLVVLLDVATGPTGTYVLAGQGYMPAMEFHVLPGPHGGWFRVEGDQLPSQPIPMPWTGLRRWR